MSKKKLPWEAPVLGGLSSRDLEKEKAKEAALGDVIEGGCWFSHVGGIHDMEEDYAKRSGRSGTDLKSSDQGHNEEPDHPVVEP